MSSSKETKGTKSKAIIPKKREKEKKADFPQTEHNLKRVKFDIVVYQYYKDKFKAAALADHKKPQESLEELLKYFFTRRSVVKAAKKMKTVAKKPKRTSL